MDEKARRVIELARASGLRVATAESCTGGLIAATLTEIAGSSDVLDRGFVVYSNQAKSEMLGVDPRLIQVRGAVSEDVARAMAEGALSHSNTDIAIAVTGIAGPAGATSTKPLGLVHIACASRGTGTLHEHHVFPGDRRAVRLAAVDKALDLMLRRIAMN